MRVNVEELNFRSEADVARVQEILARGFAKPPWNMRQAPLGWLHVVESWRSPGTKVYVAKQRGRIVGVSAGQVNHSTITPSKVLAKLGEGKHYYLDVTAVDHHKLRKGVALALHLAHEENARGEKCTAIFGETHPKSRRVIGLFTKQGFRRFHADEAANRVYYKKDLPAVKQRAIRVTELKLTNENALGEVAELYRKAFSPGEQPSNVLPEWNSIVKSYAKVPPELHPKLFIVRQNGTIIGAAFGKLHDEQHPEAVEQKLGPGKHYYLSGLAVDPLHQRSGIAKVLNKKTIGHARQLDCNSIYAYTYNERTKAMQMLQQQGFEHFHTEPARREGTRVYYKKTL